MGSETISLICVYMSIKTEYTEKLEDHIRNGSYSKYKRLNNENRIKTTANPNQEQGPHPN